MSEHLSVPELAAQIGADPKRVREWMRTQGWRHPTEAGQPWALTGEQVAVLAARFSRNPAGAIAMEPSVTPETNDLDDVAEEDETPLAHLTVGELLDTYTDVLAELRTRHLVRTNNAPIGDLAEFCAAMVYDGLLAPNSEKSYDLAAADGRKVQVKVRLVRPGMASGAVFSPIRSFDFDLCAFLVIDNEVGQVIAAREWTPEEVREHGSFKQHTNGTVVTVSQLRSSKARGVDRTADFNTAWQELLSQTR
ncbi:hypothetical protein F1C15_15765 (plasmid) [Frigoribacterium sp. NBH87]|uniref:DUF6998 domain-containing protein n=1 Tax=Frigoribacterium sp. NBH87 TaxID=2596916 RepID=UPI001624C088|nr:hypothetical protein [Frigoribacterium sp. NBH87]QNE45427.1 hypothetical protein F1C15_15765 [Frigoribacterium sp. NBH87]